MPNGKDPLRDIARRVSEADDTLRQESFEAELARIFRGETIPERYPFIEAQPAPSPAPPPEREPTFPELMMRDPLESPLWGTFGKWLGYLNQYFEKPFSAALLTRIYEPEKYEAIIGQKRGEFAGELGIDLAQRESEIEELAQRVYIDPHILKAYKETPFGEMEAVVPPYAAEELKPGGALTKLYEEGDYPKYLRGATELGVSLPFYLLAWQGFATTSVGVAVNTGLNKAFQWLFKIPIAKYVKYKTGFTPAQIKALQEVYAAYEKGMEAGAWQGIFKTGTVRYEVMKNAAKMYEVNPDAAIAYFNAFSKTDPEFVRILNEALRKASMLKLPMAAEASAGIKIYQQNMRLTPVPVAGGLPAGMLPTLPITAEKWAIMSIPDKARLVESLGLSGKIASKAWEALTEAEKAVLIAKPEVTPLEAEVLIPPKAPPSPAIPIEAEVLMATNVQKAEAHIIARDKALIDPKTGKPRQGYRQLAQNITGKKSMTKMTSEEANNFIEALNRFPEKKWSRKTGQWIPQTIPKIRAIVPENYFNLEFGEPTPVKYLTSQNFYAVKLGVAPLTQPLELAKQELDLVFPAWGRAIDGKLKELNKIYKVTLKEKLATIRANKPTRASAEMAKLLNKYEDLPPDLVAKLGMEKVKLFTWFRNLSRTMLNAQNQIREVLNMPPIPHRQAYLRHLADATVREVWQGNLSFPQDLAYWSSRIVGKKVFNPMEIPRKMTDDLLEYFSKDLGYVTKAMLWTGLKEIYLSQPLKAFTAQLSVLSKGMMPFSSLSPEEMARAGMVSVLPASLKRWVIDYVNVVIKGQQTEFDASVNRLVTQSGLGGVFNTLLKPFGRSIGTRPVTKMAQFSGRLIISATIGTKPRQIIRNLWQSTQNIGIYGIKATLQAFLPADKTLTRMLDQSMFLKTYARYEELPTSAMGKAERAWLWAYGKSAFFNARTGMKAAYHGMKKYVFDPKYKDYGWVDPARTYTEPKGFLYPSEFEALKMEMEYGSGCTQYQYIAMAMPEIFRHKTLIPFTRLQSWWMNYFFKFNREAISRFWTGTVGWDKTKKIDWVARLNWFKYVILGGAVLTAMGYKRSFMRDVLPHWAAPAGQLMMGAYSYVVADSDWERDKAKRTMFYSLRAFAPGVIDYKSFEAVWSGEKPLSSIFFYSEDWPPDMPTWGIPFLEEKVELKGLIEDTTIELKDARKRLGKLIPAEDDVEGYIYEMTDLSADIRAATRNIPPEQITKENGFSDIVLMYKQAELYWDNYYYPLPASDRIAFRENPHDICAWTEAYLFIWGKLTVLRNPKSEGVVQQLMSQYKIPDKAVPALTTQREQPAAPSTFEEELGGIFRGE